MPSTAPTSFSVPSTPAARMAASPLATRSSKNPVTPQRVGPRRSYSQSLSLSQTLHYRSPHTPSSPYTPLSLRSIGSMSNSSTLPTPPSTTSLRKLRFSETVRDTSLADIADNWRTRATDNGIKVDDAHFGDDEGKKHDSRALSDVTNDEEYSEALLPPPFMSANRPNITRPRAQSYAPTPRSPAVTRRSVILTSPAGRRVSQASSSLVLSTPPRNSHLARELKLKGSRTDPAAGRRRESFGMANSSMQSDVSFELFDIGESDDGGEHYGGDDSYSGDDYYARVGEYCAREPQSIDSYAYPQQFLYSNVNPNATCDAAFGRPLSSIPEVDQQHHPHHAHSFSTPEIYFTQSGEPNPLHDVPMSHHVLIQPTPTAQPQSPLTPAVPTTCSVCARNRPSTLAILMPCEHPLCSTCLTSALNIVGEKDMECAVCKRGVADFKLITPLVVPKANASKPVNDDRRARGKSFIDPLFSSPGSATSAQTALDGTFEFGMARSSTPKDDLSQDTSRTGITRGEGIKDNVVLRIDNVPWDITPPVIAAWLQQPVVRVHVLLDRKGKTLSHAFVEVATEDIARAVLRGEGKSGRDRSSVLGAGRRARGVTVTRSGQEELMRTFFPSWQGTFDGSNPSLAGLDNEGVIRALETGLMTESEISSLLHLIKSPDAHFLKVPCLPFYSLISILSKFPADIDSRVFWPTGLRDMLYAAIQTLVGRISNKTSVAAEQYSADLVREVIQTAIDCQAFTSNQRSKLSDYVESISQYAVRGILESYSADGAHSVDGASEVYSADGAYVSESDSNDIPFGQLAREFGVEAQLVEAVANRL
ncbi:hypothetical protein FISHEDRAFT_21033, partial [Fistulina hepatica ATCC 64428]